MKSFDCIIMEDERLYHSRSLSGEFVSSHLLQLFTKSPYKYHKTVSGDAVLEDKPEFVVGRAAHKLILEGDDSFAKSYIITDGPVNPKTGQPYGKSTQAYTAWLSTQSGEIVSTADYEVIQSMNIACHTHNGCAELLEADGFVEGVVRAEVEGVPCQIRMDFFAPDYGIIDLKTCRDIDFFDKDCRDFGYAYQLAFYQAVLEAACGEKYPVHIVVVDKTDYHIAGRWDIPDCELKECDSVNRAALRRLKRCRDAGEWPTGYERTRLFALHKD